MLHQDKNKADYYKALSTKLGCVTGMDLAQMNRAFLPKWLNIGLWLIAEASIICTDISQVRLQRVKQDQLVALKQTGSFLKKYRDVLEDHLKRSLWK